jgi:hypothetical protein
VATLLGAGGEVKRDRLASADDHRANSRPERDRYASARAAGGRWSGFDQLASPEDHRW